MELPTLAYYQRYPESGPLHDNLDLPLDDLRERLANNHADIVYAYVMTTIRTLGASFQQLGCGPNFQGGLLTICSCMKQMRTLEGVQPGIWVSGLTGVHGTRQGNGLFYLTWIRNSAVSQYELWHMLPPEVRTAKAAHLDPRGDVFEPMITLEDPEDERAYDVHNYREPVLGHVHASDDDKEHWHDDIDYVGHQTERRQAFLIGDSQRTFIWSRPLIRFHGEEGKAHPRMKPWNLKDYLSHLANLTL